MTLSPTTDFLKKCVHFHKINLTADYFLQSAVNRQSFRYHLCRQHWQDCNTNYQSCTESGKRNANMTKPLFCLQDLSALRTNTQLIRHVSLHIQFATTNTEPWVGLLFLLCGACSILSNVGAERSGQGGVSACLDHISIFEESYFPVQTYYNRGRMTGCTESHLSPVNFLFALVNTQRYFRFHLFTRTQTNCRLDNWTHQ